MEFILVSFHKFVPDRVALQIAFGLVQALRRDGFLGAFVQTQTTAFPSILEAGGTVILKFSGSGIKR